MARVKVSMLVACLIDSCAALHSPPINDVDSAGGTADSSDSQSYRLRANESATTDLMTIAKAHVNTQKDAVRNATTDEDKQLAKVSLEEANRVLGKIEAASSNSQSVTADADDGPNSSPSLTGGNILKVIMSSIFGVPAHAPDSTPSPGEQVGGGAVDEITTSLGAAVEDVNKADSKKHSSTLAATTLTTTSTTTAATTVPAKTTTTATAEATTTKTAATRTSTSAAAAEAAPAAAAAEAETTKTTTGAGTPEEEAKPEVSTAKSKTTDTSSEKEPAKQSTEQEACGTKDQEGQQPRKNASSAKMVKVAAKRTSGAKARAAESIIHSATVAEAAARRAMELASGDAEKKAAQGAMQSAKVLILRGKMMQRHAKTAKKETKKVKHQLTDAKVNEALGRSIIALTRDSITVLRKVTLAVPGAKKGLIGLLIALKTATVALGPKLEGKASGPVIGLVEKATTEASKALWYGYKALGSKDQDLKERIKHLIEIAEKIKSKAKKEEREGVVATMHKGAQEVREKSVAKDAAAKAAKAMKLVKKVIKKADVGVEALSKDLKKEAQQTAQKAKKRISKDSDMMVKAVGVNAQAATVKAAAERAEGKEENRTSIDDASKLREKAEDIVAKAKTLNEKETANVKKDMKFAAETREALSDEATALKREAEAKLKEGKAGILKLEKLVHEDIDVSKDEIKHGRTTQQRQMAEKELRTAKKNKARAKAYKTNAAKIDMAISEATKGSELHVKQLKALEEKANMLDERVKADRDIVSKETAKHRQRLVNTVAKSAKSNIAKLKVEADIVKKKAKEAKVIGRGYIKTTPRSAKHMLGDVKKATSLKLESSNEAMEAKKLAKEAMEAAADPAHAAERFKKIARKAELAAEKAREKAHQAGRVKDRIRSEAKKVLKAGEKHLSKVEKKLEARADALTKENLLEQEAAEPIDAPEGEIDDTEEAEVDGIEFEVKDVE
eukprot:TRINITY_DN11_c0_g4_i1.p1 TRINITY_DN11_c0_g4~~TRINITY_DN11_c0_g4_i1.p1  ORF type:complete len:983 (+),score=278.23 TRINITY_DN11_c0_g4_i1:72-2951(+)